MIRSTQQQVVALVAASVILAHIISIALVFALHDRRDAAAHFPDRTSVRLLAGLYRTNPTLRPELLRQAALAGLNVREIPDSVVRICTENPDNPACPAQRLSPDVPRVRVSADTWLAAEPMYLPLPHPMRPPSLAATIALVGLPTLALSLWASRGVTAPLRRLTAQAECVDPETVAAPLPVGGTTEIRLLAEAFNRLILRLTRYAADQRRMLAAVSHDLRTPLTRLRLRAETIAEPAVRQKIIHDVTAMQLLIDSALYLLQAQDGGNAVVRVDLAALLQTTADNLADGGVAVLLGEMPPVAAYCDPGHADQGGREPAGERGEIRRRRHAAPGAGERRGDHRGGRCRARAECRRQGTGVRALVPRGHRPRRPGYRAGPGDRQGSDALAGGDGWNWRTRCRTA
ncbi:MAG: HAMP domain-containing sensor histidine kinase [Rhodospirillales bacterium]